MEKKLYNLLSEFNLNIPNDYRDNWGSTVSFLPIHLNDMKEEARRIKSAVMHDSLLRKSFQDKQQKSRYESCSRNTDATRPSTAFVKST